MSQPCFLTECYKRRPNQGYLVVFIVFNYIELFILSVLFVFVGIIRVIGC